MIHSMDDRVYEVTNSFGFGDIVPAGAQIGFQSFAQSFSAGDKIFYMVDNIAQGGSDYEIGFAEYNGGAILRGGLQTILDSSTGGTIINFPNGQASVRAVAPADFFIGIWETHKGNQPPKWFREGSLWTDDTADPIICIKQYIGGNWRDVVCYDTILGTIQNATQQEIPPQAFTGDVKYSYQEFDHDNWVLADGRTLAASEFPELQSLLGSSIIPDLRDVMPVGAGGAYNIGDIGGSDTHILTQDELPSFDQVITTDPAGLHNHDVDITGDHYVIDKSVNDPLLNDYCHIDPNQCFKEAPLDAIISTITDEGEHAHNVTVPSGGADQPHNNMPPYHALNAFIYGA